MDKPYFPSPDGSVECCQCDFRDECFSADKFQRSRRSFSYTSGRCPRLPDQRGFVDPKMADLYANTFPLVYADFVADDLSLTLTLPGDPFRRRVFAHPGGYWYAKVEPDSSRILRIEGVPDVETILNQMDHLHSDHFLFRCRVEEQ